MAKLSVNDFHRTILQLYGVAQYVCICKWRNQSISFHLLCICPIVNTLCNLNVACQARVSIRLVFLSHCAFPFSFEILNHSETIHESSAYLPSARHYVPAINSSNSSCNVVELIFYSLLLLLLVFSSIIC